RDHHRHHPKLRLLPRPLLQQLGLLRHRQRLLRRRVPLRAVRGFSSPRRRPRRPYRDAELLRRDHQLGRQRMRWQEFLQARRLLDR
ncbi:unnamed protein product, partial [Musa banksii]